MTVKAKSESFPKSGTASSSFQRIETIDILRALTMVLMIFVNDFWTLKDIPEWLGHTDTLLCYLVPTFMYMTFRLIGLQLPDLLITGAAGLLKSLIFALLCVLITRGLNRMGVKLKI